MLIYGCIVLRDAYYTLDPRSQKLPEFLITDRKIYYAGLWVPSKALCEIVGGFEIIGNLPEVDISVGPCNIDGSSAIARKAGICGPVNRVCPASKRGHNQLGYITAAS